MRPREHKNVPRPTIPLESIMISIAAVSAQRLSADLFAAASAPAEAPHSKTGTLVATLDDDWCPTVPKKFPPPPPPSPAEVFERFAQVALPTPTRVLDDWCGTVPHKLPFPPPPPPWVDGINQMLMNR